MWYSRSLTLHESAGWVDLDTGFAPTHQQMLDVLSDVNGIVIAAEFIDGLETDVSGLDNVVLAPEPATVILLLPGLALLRKRR